MERTEIKTGEVIAREKAFILKKEVNLEGTDVNEMYAEIMGFTFRTNMDACKIRALHVPIRQKRSLLRTNFISLRRPRSEGNDPERTCPHADDPSCRKCDFLPPATFV